MKRDPFEESAFESFYARDARVALALARRRVGPEVAEELVAEAFLVAWRKGIHALEPEHARAWLLTTVYNLHRNLARKSSKETPVGPEGLQLIQDSSGQQNSREFSSDPYDRAWSELSESDREILTLAYHDDLASSDIESILGVTPRAARTRLSRARSRFKAHFLRFSPDVNSSILEVS